MQNVIFYVPDLKMIKPKNFQPFRIILSQALTVERHS